MGTVEVMPTHRCPSWRGGLLIGILALTYEKTGRAQERPTVSEEVSDVASDDVSDEAPGTFMRWSRQGRLGGLVRTLVAVSQRLQAGEAIDDRLLPALAAELEEIRDEAASVGHETEAGWLTLAAEALEGSVRAYEASDYYWTRLGLVVAVDYALRSAQD